MAEQCLSPGFDDCATGRSSNIELIHKKEDGSLGFIPVSVNPETIGRLKVLGDLPEVKSEDVAGDGSKTYYNLSDYESVVRANYNASQLAVVDVYNDIQKVVDPLHPQITLHSIDGFDDLNVLHNFQPTHRLLEVAKGQAERYTAEDLSPLVARADEALVKFEEAGYLAEDMVQIKFNNRDYITGEPDCYPCVDETKMTSSMNMGR